MGQTSRIAGLWFTRSLNLLMTASLALHSYAADINGDGLADTLVQSVDYTNILDDQPSVEVLSGVDSSVLWSYAPAEPGTAFGHDARWTGDLTGDGVSELVVCAPRAFLGTDKVGSVYVFDVVNDELLITLRGERGERFGVDFFDPMDITGDGILDFAVHAMALDINGIPVDIVHMYSGATFSRVLYEVTEFTDGVPAVLQPDLELRGDFDGNGILDSVDLTLLLQLIADNDQVGDINDDGETNKLDFDELTIMINSPPPASELNTDLTPLQTSSLKSMLLDWCMLYPEDPLCETLWPTPGGYPYGNEALFPIDWWNNRGRLRQNSSFLIPGEFVRDFDGCMLDTIDIRNLFGRAGGLRNAVNNTDVHNFCCEPQITIQGCPSTSAQTGDTLYLSATTSGTCGSIEWVVEYSAGSSLVPLTDLSGSSVQFEVGFLEGAKGAVTVSASCTDGLCTARDSCTITIENCDLDVYGCRDLLTGGMLILSADSRSPDATIDWAIVDGGTRLDVVSDPGSSVFNAIGSDAGPVSILVTATTPDGCVSERLCTVNVELDSDLDGISDDDELTGGTDPNNADSDGDGVPDGYESDTGSDPNDPLDSSETDTDGDGLPDFVEEQIGTDPEVQDTDGDGVNDGDEIDQGTDPGSTLDIPTRMPWIKLGLQLEDTWESHAFDMNRRVHILATSGYDRIALYQEIPIGSLASGVRDILVPYDSTIHFFYNIGSADIVNQQHVNEVGTQLSPYQGHLLVDIKSAWAIHSTDLISIRTMDWALQGYPNWDWELVRGKTLGVQLYRPPTRFSPGSGWLVTRWTSPAQSTLGLIGFSSHTIDWRSNHYDPPDRPSVWDQAQAPYYVRNNDLSDSTDVGYVLRVPPKKTYQHNWTKTWHLVPPTVIGDRWPSLSPNAQDYLHNLKSPDYTWSRYQRTRYSFCAEGAVLQPLANIFRIYTSHGGWVHAGGHTPEWQVSYSYNEAPTNGVQAVPVHTDSSGVPSSGIEYNWESAATGGTYRLWTDIRRSTAESEASATDARDVADGGNFISSETKYTLPAGSFPRRGGWFRLPNSLEHPFGDPWPSIEPIAPSSGWGTDRLRCNIYLKSPVLAPDGVLIASEEMKLTAAAVNVYDLEATNPSAVSPGRIEVPNPADLPSILTDADRVDGAAMDGTSCLLLEVKPPVPPPLNDKLRLRLFTGTEAKPYDNLQYAWMFGNTGSLYPYARDTSGTLQIPELPHRPTDNSLDAVVSLSESSYVVYVPPDAVGATTPEHLSGGPQTLHLPPGLLHNSLGFEWDDGFSPYRNEYLSPLEVDIVLVTPPLVLVHGVYGQRDGYWSSGFAADAGLREYYDEVANWLPGLTSERILNGINWPYTPVYIHDYELSNASGFDINVISMIEAIWKVRDDYRNRGDFKHDGYAWRSRSSDLLIDFALAGGKYACTMVDMVGHSMGGQLMRWHIADFKDGVVSRNIFEFDETTGNWQVIHSLATDMDPLFGKPSDGKSGFDRPWSYLRHDNYGAGDIRRAVFVGSPFHGNVIASKASVSTKTFRLLLNLLKPDNYNDVATHPDGRPANTLGRVPAAVGDLAYNGTAHLLMAGEPVPAGLLGPYYPSGAQHVPWIPLVGDLINSDFRPRLDYDFPASAFSNAFDGAISANGDSLSSDGNVLTTHDFARTTSANPLLADIQQQLILSGSDGVVRIPSQANGLLPPVPWTHDIQQLGVNGNRSVSINDYVDLGIWDHSDGTIWDQWVPTTRAAKHTSNTGVYHVSLTAPLPLGEVDHHPSNPVIIWHYLYGPAANMNQNDMK